MSKNKRKVIEETSTNVKHPRLKSASRIASSNPASIALPEILETVIPLNTHKTIPVKRSELGSGPDGEKSHVSGESRKPQIDNHEKEEILASFEALTTGEGKTREQAYKIISDIRGKSMKTNILRWLKERDDLLRTGTPKPDGRKERRSSAEGSVISSKARAADSADGDAPAPRVKKTVSLRATSSVPSHSR